MNHFPSSRFWRDDSSARLWLAIKVSETDEVTAALLLQFAARHGWAETGHFIKKNSRFGACADELSQPGTRFPQ